MARSPLGVVGVLAVVPMVSLPGIGCSGASRSPAPSEAPRGRLDLVYFPDPAVRAPAPAPNPGFVARVEMRIREVGGVGVRLTLVQVGVSTDPAATLVLGAAEIADRAGSHRVEAGSLLVLQVEVAYATADSFGDVQVIIEGVDDLGNAVDYNGGLPIRAPPGAGTPPAQSWRP